MSPTPISVVVPVYNRAATLPRCLESVLAQTFTDWEMIVVDDGSTDNSFDVLQRYRDPRIRAVRHESNRGAGPARETAIAAATGEWIALLDSDDEWLPSKLAVQHAMTQRRSAELFSCRYYFTRDGETRVLPKPSRDSLAGVLHRECPFGFGSTLLIRRTSALYLGGFDPALPRHDDWDWVFRAANCGMILNFIEEPLVRVHAVDRPCVEVFASSTERFLAKYDSRISIRGRGYRRSVIASHYESIASMAYEQRRFAFGDRYLWRSFAMWPLRPYMLAALPLGIVDRLVGTRLIQHGARLRRKWFANDPPIVTPP